MAIESSDYSETASRASPVSVQWLSISRRNPLLATLQWPVRPVQLPIGDCAAPQLEFGMARTRRHVQLPRHVASLHQRPWSCPCLSSCHHLRLVSITVIINRLATLPAPVLSSKHHKRWSIVHVKSHRDYKLQGNDLDAWTAFGNDVAEEAAKTANRKHLPQERAIVRLVRRRQAVCRADGRTSAECRW